MDWFSRRRVRPPLGDRLARFLESAATPGDSDEIRLYKRLLIGGVSASVPLLLLNGTLCMLAGAPPAAAPLYIHAALTGAWLGAFRRGHGDTRRMGAIQLTLTLLDALAVALILGGLEHEADAELWGLIVPIGALILDPARAWRWFAAYAGGLAALALLGHHLTPLARLSPDVEPIYRASNLLGISAFVFGVMYYFVRQRAEAFRLLGAAQEKSESLLRNMLPREIATILKDGPRPIAEHFAGASILFSDIADFTPLSSGMPAAELVALLNEVFSHFDALAAHYGLEKIKTIGDCYMVAAGVPQARPDHAQVAARMALAMQDYVKSHTFPQGRRLTLRIGIHSGPVVAGVIGTHKFSYDLWGDTVNTASRMESHGSDGQIQVSQATYELIQAEFVCAPRGQIEVKGKGPMAVWYLLAGQDGSLPD